MAAAAALGARPDAASLPAINRARDPIEPSSKVVADPTPEGTGGGGSGGPFEEKNALERTFHPDVAIKSTDGLFTLVIHPVRTLLMDDSEGADTLFTYDNPYIFP